MESKVGKLYLTKVFVLCTYPTLPNLEHSLPTVFARALRLNVNTASSEITSDLSTLEWKIPEVLQL